MQGHRGFLVQVTPPNLSLLRFDSWQPEELIDNPVVCQAFPSPTCGLGGSFLPVVYTLLLSSIGPGN